MQSYSAKELCMIPQRREQLVVCARYSTYGLRFELILETIFEALMRMPVVDKEVRYY